MNPPYIPATALGGGLLAPYLPVTMEWHADEDPPRWVSGVIITIEEARDGTRVIWYSTDPHIGFDNRSPVFLRLDPRQAEVQHRIADVLRAKGHEVGHLLPVALGGRQGDVQANAPIPASCSFHGNARHVEPLPACLRCGGSGRVTFESDDFPPGTNACCCTCSGCRSEKVTIPAADVSAVLLAASVAGVEAGRGVVRGVLFQGDYNIWRDDDGTVEFPPGEQPTALAAGYAYLSLAAPFGVVVPLLNLENER